LAIAAGPATISVSLAPQHAHNWLIGLRFKQLLIPTRRLIASFPYELGESRVRHLHSINGKGIQID
jgi:hypothetical protein